ncbi:HAD-IA family hydrolase [Geminicoccus flavidas]|uniref:HAD-IA family hydrolase n=1 Tax=Geminicoccus flavidas TaxID=2506407 RepID=UPI00190FB94F|nr:HAD-IA family hydrolase [Geminicoccus flavidas]
MTLRPLFPHREFAAFLFDMDGTVLSSIAAAERVWGRWARRHGLDVEAFLPTMHGKRAVDTIRRLNLPGVDPEVEADWITKAEIEDVGGVHAIDGAATFLAALPPERWTIVTSSPLPLARRRLEAAGLSAPPRMVTAEDITQGKPAPDCFLLGAERLGFPARDCLVFEDAPAGIEAAEAAGAAVVVITATHTHPAATAHPAVPGFDGLRAETTPSGALQLVAAV